MTLIEVVRTMNLVCLAFCQNRKSQVNVEKATHGDQLQCSQTNHKATKKSINPWQNATDIQPKFVCSVQTSWMPDPRPKTTVDNP